MREQVIRAEGLSVRYEGAGVAVDALKDATFGIRQGEFVVVLGPSGSGKSTLLNVTGGMDKPTSGRLWYCRDGEEKELTALTMDQLAGYRRKVVGFVFQFFNLIPSLTAKENVELASSLTAEHLDAGKVLRMVGLEGRENHFPAQLSGGEQQRVSIARAIVKNPALLLCDEPTGALDSKNSASIVELLLKVRDRLGCPVVVITHNAELSRAADRIFRMKDGRIERTEENEAPCGAGELNW